MYDDEEEIKRKRRNLIIIIAVIVVLIILLLLFLFMRGRGKTTPVNQSPKCELEVKSGTIGADDIYSTSVVVGFKSVTPISDAVPITSKTVGTSNNTKNKETYTITKKGKITVNGYIKDANGNTGTCNIVVEVNPSKPTCELEVTSGTLGENEWYKSEVVVAFKSKEVNSETAKIEKYYIEKKVSELDSDEVIRADPPEENSDTFTVTDNLTTQLFGYVIDSNGNEGTCSITVKKDDDLPTCKLNVVSGTQNTSGIYTSNVVVGMDTVEDKTSDVVEKGVGLEKNYTQETQAVTAAGTTTVHGYVKDEAGNEGTCSIDIKRPSATPAPTPSSIPSCKLTIAGTQNGNIYSGATVIKFESKASTNGASIVSYGIGTSQTLNGQDSFTLNTNGTHVVYGMVKDSNGRTATCGPLTVNVQMSTPLSQKVKVGDLVAYDAGTWAESASIPSADGTFGGYSAGASKNNSVSCRGEAVPAGGWKVLSVSGSTVTIVHAGVSECYYHAVTSSTTAVSKLNSRATEMYLNPTYAQSARMLGCQDMAGGNCTENAKLTGVQAANAHYYVASVKDTTTLWYVSNGNSLRGGSARANGVRPVIILRNDVATTGQDANGAWILTTANRDIDPSIIELPDEGIVSKILNDVDNIIEIITNFSKNK